MSDSPSSDAPLPTEERRGFIAVLAAGVGLIAGLIPALAGAVTFLDPVIRREKKFVDPNKPEGQKTEDGYIRVASAADLPTTGEPLRVQVRDDVTNKWTFSPDEPIGEVFLIQNKPGGELTAFTTVCPHLGCSISLGTDADGKQIFKCPCHNSSFEVSGAMIAEGNPSPRDMDTLDARVDNGEVYVKYQNFHTGRATKQAKD